MKKIFIVVDMQKDFISGSLGSTDAQGIVDKVAEKIEEERKNGSEIIFTLDTHYENYPETLEGKKLPVSHCVENTDGWKLDEKLQPLVKDEKELVIKPTFGSVHLAEDILKNKVDSDTEIELCGLCTDICVVSNALLLRAFFPNTRISVNSELCRGTSMENHNAALTTMKCCHIDVI